MSHLITQAVMYGRASRKCICQPMLGFTKVQDMQCRFPRYPILISVAQSVLAQQTWPWRSSWISEHTSKTKKVPYRSLKDEENSCSNVCWNELWLNMRCKLLHIFHQNMLKIFRACKPVQHFAPQAGSLPRTVSGRELNACRCNMLCNQDTSYYLPS